VDNDSYITEPKEIMKEIYDFYAKLYDRDSYNLVENSIDRFLNEVDTKKLSDEEKKTLVKQLTRSELYEALKTFLKNKTPGNDGLTVEFYLAFRHVVAKYLEKSLNFSLPLSTSQKQAMITLLKKKIKIDDL